MALGTPEAEESSLRQTEIAKEEETPTVHLPTPAATPPDGLVPGASPASLLALVARREGLTQRLSLHPYDPVIYLERAAVHAGLGYPDLAVGDAYRALLLCDDLDGGEYEEHAYSALEEWVDGDVAELGLVIDVPQLRTVESLSASVACSAYHLLADNLLQCGCLRSAATFCERGLRCCPGDEALVATRAAIDVAARKRSTTDHSGQIPTADLPDAGFARREIYPWNEHERDRYAKQSIDELNARLSVAAPKCEVRVATLPVLLASSEETLCQQLGVFAKEDISPGEAVLEEYSLITASTRHMETVCDACNTELPSAEFCVPCDGCDVVFCSEHCAHEAMERYHPVVCDREDFDAIGKEPSPFEADYCLYLLLLGRVIAIAAHEECHPLDVTEVKFLWGDFTPIGAPASLPFNFKYNIEEPLHLLETMDIDIYKNQALYDTWVLNTLYSKFRGVASARKAAGGLGAPDVAAVHPLWCLANHDCDPNVSWEWGGRITLTAKEHRLLSAPGLRAGDEVLNHYCDLDLPVKERREWASGPLGGDCQCNRCCAEASLETGL